MPGVTGMQKRAPLAPGSGRARMWQSMRVLRQFCAAELVAAAEVSASHARTYLRALVADGYLRVVQPKRDGETGGHVVYQLVRDTGPYAPRVGKHGLHDANTDPTPPRRAAGVTISRSEYQRALRCIAYTERARAAGDPAAAAALEVVQ